MKLPFVNKNNSSPSYSSSWPWPSCHQNPKTLSFRGTITQDDHELDPITVSIEDVIKEIKSSERLIFESKGESKSILKKEATIKREEGFMLLSLESNDPYTDFMRSMEEMVEAHALHHDLKSLEKLLFKFLKVNVKTNHGYIYAAFVDLLMNLSLLSNNNNAKDDDVSASRAAVGEASTSSSCISMNLAESPSSPLSFDTSCSSYSSSDEASLTSAGFLPLSSLLKIDEKD